MLIHNSIPVILYDKLLTIRDTGKEIKLKGDPLKMITNKNYKVDLASLADKNLKYDFPTLSFYPLKPPGKKLLEIKRLLKCSNHQVYWFLLRVFRKKTFSSSDPHELCNRLQLLLQEKQAGNNFDIINEKIVAIVEKLLEYNCISKKQHKQLLIKCNLIHE